MTSPFSKNSTAGKPSWTVQSPIVGAFSTLTIIGKITPEVAYNEDGYGVAAYDAPAIVVPSIAASPVWTLKTDK